MTQGGLRKALCRKFQAEFHSLVLAGKTALNSDEYPTGGKVAKHYIFMRGGGPTSCA